MNCIPMNGAVDGQVLVRVGGKNLLLGVAAFLGANALFLVVAAQQVLLLLLLAQGSESGAQATRGARLGRRARNRHGEVALQRHDCKVAALMTLARRQSCDDALAQGGSAT